MHPYSEASPTVLPEAYFQESVYDWSLREDLPIKRDLKKKI